jgi:hypothetical protein
VTPKEQVVSEFIFAYRAPENYRGTPDTATIWDSWFDALGANLFDNGNPVFVTTCTGNTGGDLRLGGYSLISAEKPRRGRRIGQELPDYSERRRC